MATKASPDGGALPKMIARWVSGLQASLITEGILPDAPDFSARLSAKIFLALEEIEMMVGGFDFARVITGYYEAYLDGNEEGKSACLRWLRGEFSTKTEARSALGFSVSTIISDENWYDFLKLWAALVRTPAMGYRGLVVFIDECVNLYKINHRVSRENNYEKILSMFNDTLQGRAPGLALVLGGTPQFLEDTRRGLFSYEALRSRLCDSRFALEGFKNLIGPVIRLRRLSDDELFALIQRVTKLYAQNYAWEPRITEEEMVAFLGICLSRAGANSMITPREMLRDYMTVLNILMQNPTVSFYDIVGTAVTLKTPDEIEDEEEAQKGKDTAEKEEESASLAAFGPAEKGEASGDRRHYTPDDIDF